MPNGIGNNFNKIRGVCPCTRGSQDTKKTELVKGLLTSYSENTKVCTKKKIYKSCKREGPDHL